MDIKQGNNKFYIGESEDDFTAEITFVYINKEAINVNHTFVDPSLRGGGVARKLMDKVVEFAIENNLKIKPTCSYAVKVFPRYPEYEQLIYKS
ncbi:MAG: GNAT family N-acetyltransferase [Candidatus Izemoplasmataceae bacterium]